jgi:hypothetical protein
MSRVKTLIAKYTSRVGLPRFVADEFLRAFPLIERLKAFPISDVFVEDYFEESGRRIYANFCFFGSDFFAEATNPKEPTNEGSRDVFVVSLKAGLAKVSIPNYKDYDFDKATDKSRVTIAFYLKNGESFFLNASGRNCDGLWDIYRSRLMSLL